MIDYLREMQIVKYGSLLLAIILAMTSIFLIATGTLAAVLAIASGIGLVYYLALFFAVIVFKSKIDERQALKTVLWVLFLFPILGMMIDPESMVNMFMPDIKMDMK